MKKIYSTIILSFWAIVYSQLSAQALDSALSRYADNFQQEKIHLHFDKAIYNKGETIWLKAYVLAGLDLSDYSMNFYMDWYSDKGVLLKHTANPMYESTARGQFEIPDNYGGQYLHVKAYTQWMLNFDSAFIFNKNIRIDQSAAAITNTLVKSAAISKAAISAPSARFITPKTTLHFFPEGGDLVKNVLGKVAFLAENEYGYPVKASGTVKNSKGKIISVFKTEHDGMGSLKLMPDSTQPYTANWADEYGALHNTTLPVAQEQGVLLSVEESDHKIKFTVAQTKVNAAANGVLYVIGHLNQHLLFKSKITMGEREKASGEIADADWPTGVVQVTLFDADYRPLAERAVFVNNNDYRFRPGIRVTTKGVDKHERNVLEIEVEDTLVTNMSLAVTDAGLVTDTACNIISDLLLSGEVKGYLHQPAQYFESDEDSVKHFLDLVMMTHGWRRINWKNVADGKMPAITYPKETDFMQLKGSIYGITDKNTLKNENMFLIFKGKQDGNQTLMLPIDHNKEFVQKGFLFFDTLQVYYQLAGNKNLSNRMTVNFQTGLLPLLYKTYNGIATEPYTWSYSTQDSLRLARSRTFYSEQDRIRKQLEGHELEEVIVKTKAKRKEDVMDEKYTSGLFSGGDSKQFDVISDPFAKGSPDVFSYLQGRVAGLMITNNGAVVSMQWRGGTPDVYLNEMKVGPEQLKNIPMTDIAYVKVFSPPFFGSFGGGSGGAISVYTRRGNDVKSVPGEGLTFQRITGYTAYRQFYSPDYRTNPNDLPDGDVRTTLYWNPYILTDKKKKTVQVIFYNNDISKKLRLVLEGINGEGKVARVEKVIE